MLKKTRPVGGMTARGHCFKKKMIFSRRSRKSPKPYPTRWRTDTANQRGGSECEPKKILLEGDGDSNKTNTASNTRLRITTQVGQVRAATGVLLNLGTNKQPSEPKLINMHSGNLHGLLPVLHRSDRWHALVRPVDRAGQAGGYNSRARSVPESLSDFSRPWNKNTPKTQPARKKSPTQCLAKQLQTDQELTNNTTTQRHTSQAVHPWQIPQVAYTSQTSRTHRLDRSSLGSLGWTALAGQLPQIQLSISRIAPRICTRLWGIVGTPHEESIPRLCPPNLVKSRGIEEIPPRTPLTLEHRKPQNWAP
jgi:hypothetical protein